ncbi:tetratricopeptide repeat protein [Candidatus Leptofilum sp.]|uniref:tetratricopeptide repeat protein n=1 Tax=Candidatus Leptofilum sp. TaxID=3241576 RepID=UPI003B5A68F2
MTVSLADLVSKYKERSGLSFSQISQKSGVPAKTITSWANGFVKRPRHWRDLVSSAKVLGLTKAEVDELLQTAGHSPIDTLLGVADEKGQKLLSGWQEKAPPIQLPRLHIHEFIGRLEEQQIVTERLLKNERLCAIQGMGGIGKTSLAVHIAQSLAPQFRDGILWADMRNLENDQILENWALAYDVDISALSNVEGRASYMWGVLTGKNTLIILDDATSLQRVKQLIPSQLADCSILVTTRQKTIAHGLTPVDEAIVSLQPMREQNSLQLLQDSLGFSFAEAPQFVKQEICELLGYLPLAVNIFARRARLLMAPLPMLLEQLRSIRTRLNRLQVGDEAVRTAFEQSWELLEGTLQQAFRLLALFSGRSFSLEAFAHIANIDLLMATTTLGELYALFLLEIVSEEPRRYKQHPLLASFAHEKANNPPELYLQVSAYYQTYAEEHTPNYEVLREDWQNIMAGMRHAYTQQSWELVLDYVGTLQPVWFTQAQYSSARQGYGWADEAALAASNEKQLADIQLHWGIACLEQSDYLEAAQKLKKSLDLFQSVEDAQGIANAHYHSARVQLEQDSYDEAEQALQEAWHHYQIVEDVSGMANSLYRMGNIAYHRAEYEEATKLCHDALKLQRELSNQLGILKVLLRLTMIALAQEYVDEAQSYCADALLLSEALDDQAETARTYYTFANLCRQQSEFEMARDYIERSLDLFQQMGDRSSEANALNVAALIELDWGKADLAQAKYHLAYEHARQSQEISKQLDFQFGIANARLTLGRIYRRQDNVEAACQEWEAALTIARTIKSNLLETRLNELNDRFC